MRLTIFNVNQADYGMYKCVAKNPRGETDGTIRVYSELRCVFLFVHETKTGRTLRENKTKQRPTHSTHSTHAPFRMLA